jgi:AAA domain
MRIAFSGSHRVGKTSLVGRVAERFPRYSVVEEPYVLLEEEGYDHADPPALEDFEAQLERSLDVLEERNADVLFDRCPADVLAYLLTHEDHEEFDSDEWLERVREAMQTLDLVVFVPIEERDRIAVPESEDRSLRRKVHRKLEQLLLDDSLGFEVEVLTVEGDLAVRADQVSARLRSA